LLTSKIEYFELLKKKKSNTPSNTLSKKTFFKKKA